MQLSRLQERALDRVGAWLGRWYRGDRDQQTFYLAGYAGSGKSTIANRVAANVDGPVEYCAYTGKAAHVMVRKGCPDARTIHSLIYLQAGQVTEKQVEQQREQLAQARAATPVDEDEVRRLAGQLAQMEESAARKGPRFMLNPASRAADADLIIVDECSMVDDRTGRDLESFGKPILVLGDPAQLPPVMGGGYFTSREPDVLLDEVHRQATDSPILALATEIRQGRLPRYGSWGEGCDVLRYGDPSLERRALAADQILVGRNKTRHACNHKVRRLRGFENNGLPATGDRVICLRNDHEAGLLNGALFDVKIANPVDDQTIMLEVEDDEGNPTTCVAWLHHFQGREDELSPFVKRDCQEFAFGYAITVHKSQGSQWDHVCVFDESSAFGASAWRHLYTAVTRAAKQLTLVT